MVFAFFHEEKQKLKNGICPILVLCTKTIRSQRQLMAAAHYRTVGHCQSVDALMPISSDFCWATQNWFACHRIRLSCRWPRNVPAALVRAWLLRGIPWIARKLSLFDLQVKSIVQCILKWCHVEVTTSAKLQPAATSGVENRRNSTGSSEGMPDKLLSPPRIYVHSPFQASAINDGWSSKVARLSSFACSENTTNIDLTIYIRIYI